MVITFWLVPNIQVFVGNVNESLKHYESARKLSQSNFLRNEEVESSKKLIEARIQIAQKVIEWRNGGMIESTKFIFLVGQGGAVSRGHSSLYRNS